MNAFIKTLKMRRVNAKGLTTYVVNNMPRRYHANGYLVNESVGINILAVDRHASITMVIDAALP